MALEKVALEKVTALRAGMKVLWLQMSVMKKHDQAMHGIHSNSMTGCRSFISKCVFHTYAVATMWKMILLEFAAQLKCIHVLKYFLGRKESKMMMISKLSVCGFNPSVCISFKM